MITDYCSIKTITEIEGNKVKISCICSEKQDGIDTPTLFRVDMLNKPSIINRIQGLEGELLITHIDSNNNIAEINDKGELIISLDDDDVEKYTLDDKGNLIYNE